MREKRLDFNENIPILTRLTTSFNHITIMIFFIGISFFVIFFLAKDFLFRLYVLQLKEYRIDKLKDFFITAQGYKTIFSKKNALRLTMLIALIVLVVIDNDSAGFKFLQRIIVFNILCIVSMVDILPLFIGWKNNTTKKPEWTQRIILVTIASVSFLILNYMGYLFLIIRNFPFIGENSKNLSMMSVSFYLTIILSYIILAQLFSPLLIGIGHILVYPIARWKKKSILYHAQKKIAKRGDLCTIAIAGSYGKSSIKLLLSNILSVIEDKQNNNTSLLLSPPGNINTELGISQYILSHLKDNHHYFVTEFGTYAIGESKIIGDIVNQKIGFLAGLNNQHVGLFGSLEHAIKAETEILIALQKNKGTLYANRDDHLVRSLTFPGIQLVRYSIENPTADAYISDIQGKSGSYSFAFCYKEKKDIFKTDLIGKHNLLNLAGVLACVYDEGMPYEIVYEYCKHLAQYQKTLHITSLSNDREHITLIDDSYNINSTGIKAGLDLLADYEGKKYVVIDEIIELGKETEETHRQIGWTLAQYQIDTIYLVGKHYSHYIAQGYQEKKGISDLVVLSAPDPRNFSPGSGTILFLGRESKKYLDVLQSKI